MRRSIDPPQFIQERGNKVEEESWGSQNPRSSHSLAVQARDWKAIESGGNIQPDNAGHGIESYVIPQKHAMYSSDAE